MQTGFVDKPDVLLLCTTKKCNLFDKVIIFATDFFYKVVQQQYVGEVGKSIIVLCCRLTRKMYAKYHRNWSAFIETIVK